MSDREAALPAPASENPKLVFASLPLTALLVVSVFVVVFMLPQLPHAAYVLDGILPDSDDVMRLLSVRDLLHGHPGSTRTNIATCPRGGVDALVAARGLPLAAAIWALTPLSRTACGRRLGGARLAAAHAPRLSRDRRYGDAPDRAALVRSSRSSSHARRWPSNMTSAWAASTITRCRWFWSLRRRCSSRSTAACAGRRSLAASSPRSLPPSGWRHSPSWRSSAWQTSSPGSLTTAPPERWRGSPPRSPSLLSSRSGFRPRRRSGRSRPATRSPRPGCSLRPAARSLPRAFAFDAPTWNATTPAHCGGRWRRRHHCFLRVRVPPLPRRPLRDRAAALPVDLAGRHS